MNIPKVYSIGDYKIIRFDEIDSTNEYAWNLLSNSNPKENVVIIAENQTAGKGQYGRKWETDRGENIIMTTIKSPNFLKARDAFHLNVITSLTIIDMLQALSNEEFIVKWPNDIYFGNKKIAGVLIKNKIQDGLIKQSIIGTGININQVSFPKELKNPISLYQITKEKYVIEEAIQLILKGYDHYFKMVESKRMDKIYNGYNEKLFGKNEWRSFFVSGEKKELKILNVSQNGSLSLESKDGSIVEYNAGLEYVI